MSFINSILNSIGSKNSPPPSDASSVTIARSSPAKPEQTEDKDPQAAKNFKASATNKRAAEDTLVQRRKRVAKTGQNAISGGETVVSKAPIANGKLFAAPKSNISIAKVGNSAPKLLSQPLVSSPAPSPASSRAAPEAPSKKEPKKGSYAEIMARAKANQAKPTAVGTISHKPKEKGALTYKQELKHRKRAKKDQRLGVGKDVDDSRPDSADDALNFGKAASKDVKSLSMVSAKKPRPQPAYKGTMNPASVTLKAKEKAAAQAKRRDDQYADTDDDLDEDEIEEGGGSYDDDESDDMEAGFLDVEEEETAAEKAARKEDEEEARLEANLKRQKEERKKRMAELAKKAKPQRY